MAKKSKKAAKKAEKKPAEKKEAPAQTEAKPAAGGSVSPADIKKLRDMTGAGMMDCKKALVEFSGDIDKASEELRKKGLAKAAKRGERETAQGRVVSYIHGEGTIGVLLQLNCETDFVSRNEAFESLARDIAMHVAASDPLFISSEDVDQAAIDKESEIIAEQLKTEGKKPEQIEKIVPGKIKKYFSEVCLLEQVYIKAESKQTVADVLKEAISKFGENITVGRFVRYKVG
jgi:elongation factor Ts